MAERFSGKHDTAVSDRFEGIDCRQDGEKWLVLKDSNAFGCQVIDTLVSGTHTVFLGNVMVVQTSSDEPLTYQQGRYRQLAQ